MFSHLGNGCPAQLHRHNNIVQRVLSLREDLWISFIADGAHVSFPALGNYLRSAGVARCVIVTDAISAAGLGPGRYTLGQQTVEIGADLVPWSTDRSHFVGSATTMPSMVANLQHNVQLLPDQIRQLTKGGPRQVLGLEPSVSTSSSV